MQRRLLRGAAALVVVSIACDPKGDTAPPIPPAEAYDRPVDFAGEWIGEVEGSEGTLTIDSLGPNRYRGVYEVDATPTRYVLALEQTMVPQGDATVGSNRVTFTWQDGRGGRGDGWLLINREGTALTGEFGEGEGHSGGSWTFIRLE